MARFKRLLVTGGAGFIGSAFIRHVMGSECERIVNLDALTYAADLRNLHPCDQDARYLFVKGDICDEALVEKLCLDEKIDAIVHFAAETHVDRSIAHPKAFLYTNVQGTLSLLEVMRKHKHIHFHHVSTDEVYGSLPESGHFSEDSPYRPNSPYAASKAASDHFVRAYVHTFGISATLSHCTNNYGPFQHVEKFIPRMIAGCMHKEPLPIYGEGIHVRDWLYVDDHSKALSQILEKGKSGESYAIGGGCEKKNNEVVQEIIEIYAELTGENKKILSSLVTHVGDRPGHDLRYAMDFNKIKKEMGWSPIQAFSLGLRQTITWYLENEERLVI